MKYKVIRKFRDKNTAKLYEVDSVYETSDKRRAEFLQKKGFIGEEIKDKKPEKKKADKK